MLNSEQPNLLMGPPNILQDVKNLITTLPIGWYIVFMEQRE